MGGRVGKVSREVGGCNKTGEQNVNTPYFVHKWAHVHTIFLLLVENEMEVEEGNKTTKSMQWFDSSNKVQ